MTLAVGFVVSTIFTVLVTVPVFHELSTLLYSKRYVPTSFGFTVHEVGEAINPDPSVISVRVAPDSV